MIAVACACSYEAKVPEQFAGQVVRCPQCRETISVGTPTPRPAPSIQTPMPAPGASTPHPQKVYPASRVSDGFETPTAAPVLRESCRDCKRDLSPKDPICRHCGWDKKERQRKCVKCSMPIVHDDGPGFAGYGIAMGIVGLILFRLIGVVGVLSVAAFLGSLSGIGSVMKMRWRCGGCDREPDPAILSDEEKTYHRKRWTAFLFGTIGLGVLSLSLAILWLVIAAKFAD